VLFELGFAYLRSLLRLLRQSSYKAGSHELSRLHYPLIGLYKIINFLSSHSTGTHNADFKKASKKDFKVAIKVLKRIFARLSHPNLSLQVSNIVPITRGHIELITLYKTHFSK